MAAGLLVGVMAEVMAVVAGAAMMGAAGAQGAAVILVAVAPVATLAATRVVAMEVAAVTEQAKLQRGLLGKLGRIFKHRWMDERDVRRAVPPELLTKLERYIAASEARHTGEIRICIEAGLPMSYLWRNATPRERAITMFGKLRVWDTERNNGVLIYLLLAENAIEIIADRAVFMPTNAMVWQEIVDRLAVHLRRSDFERGLTQALEEISAVLAQHFPQAADQARQNELPNAPDVR
jgi:uncharacterized membrane protein